MSRQQKLQLFFVTETFLFALLALSAANGASTVIAVAGPGGAGTVSSVHNAPDINDSGQIVYAPALQNIGRSLLLKDGPTTTELVVNGDPAPDGNGKFFAHIDDPILNNAGQVAFRGALEQTSGGFNDSLGIFLADEDGVVQIAREGSPVPDQAFLFDNFHYPTLNKNGQVAFQAQIRNSGFKLGLYRSDGTMLEEVVRFDRLRPDGLGTFGLLGGWSMNNLGHVAFSSNDITGTNEGPFASLYMESGGALTEIAHQGQPVPGQDATFQSFPYERFALNDSGNLLFQANVTNNAGGPAYWGIYLSSGTGIVPIVRKGDTIPNGAGTFSQLGFFPYSLNAQNETVFVATFTDGGIQHTGLFTGSSNGTIEIARSGQPAPDGVGTIGGVFSGITELDDSGRVAFTAASSNSNPVDAVAYLFDGDKLIPIARVGQPLAGSTLKKITSLSSADTLNLNASGQVVFQFELADSRTGIFLYTPDDLPGDFNHDGVVDAADYVVWRKTDDPQGGYDQWRNHFGQSANSGSSTSAQGLASIPEPTAVMMLLVAAALMAPLRSVRSCGDLRSQSKIA